MKKNELPGWFPFAITASFLIAIGAGIRSNWTLAADQPKPPPEPPNPPQPPVKQAGMIQGVPTWGPTVVGMSQQMRWAGLSAVHGSKGRPRMVDAPDGNTYLFAIENGALIARPLVAIG